MRRMHTFPVVEALGLIAMLGLSQIAFAQKEPGFLGVWQVTEVTTTGPAAATYQAQPGFYIFTPKHYSIVAVNSDKPRPQVPTDTQKATAAELLAVWGGAFTASAGTYRATSDTITITPKVAKNPLNMSPSSYAVHKFRQEGDLLWLTIVETPFGPTANPTTLKLTRAE